MWDVCGGGDGDAGDHELSVLQSFTLTLTPTLSVCFYLATRIRLIQLRYVSGKLYG